MSPSEIDPNAQPFRWTRSPRPGEAAAAAAERRSFAPPPDEARRTLLAFLEAELHAPAMLAEPHPLSEEHRERLVKVQEAIRAEMARLKACESAEEIVATLLQRLDGGSLDQLEDDARFLGFRAIADLADDLVEHARTAGVTCPEPHGVARQAAPGRKVLSSARFHERRQERLLDEGIEETFPASDPVSVPRVDD